MKRSTKPIPKIGRRGKRLLDGDKEVSEKVRSRGYCELKQLIPKVICAGELQHHHIVKRGVLATRHDENYGLCVCMNHHEYLHHHPEEARKMRLIIDSKSNVV